MTDPMDRHQHEIHQNRAAWERKPLLREIYSGFYRQIEPWLDQRIEGQIVEIGSGIGNLKQRLPKAVATDLFPNPWLDLVCDAYDLPFRNQTVSHLVLFDVFHHLAAPNAFLHQAERVLVPGGRVLLFEPYMSLASSAVYGALHPEPIAWRKPINESPDCPRPRAYYAAQGNATRLFFGRRLPLWLSHWSILHRERFSCFHYLLSGGYSRPSFYPGIGLEPIRRFDRVLSKLPRLFAARCLVVLQGSLQN